MNATCQLIQRALAERGPGALRNNGPAQRHVAECSDCFRFLEAAAEVESGLGAVPAVDAPDELVAQVLLAVQADEPEVDVGDAATENGVAGVVVSEPWWLPRWRSFRRRAASGAALFARLVRYRQVQVALVATVVAVVVGVFVLSTRERELRTYDGLASPDEPLVQGEIRYRASEQEEVAEAEPAASSPASVNRLQALEKNKDAPVGGYEEFPEPTMEASRTAKQDRPLPVQVGGAGLEEESKVGLFELEGDSQAELVRELDAANAKIDVTSELFRRQSSAERDELAQDKKADEFADLANERLGKEGAGMPMPRRAPLGDGRENGLANAESSLRIAGRSGERAPAGPSPILESPGSRSQQAGKEERADSTGDDLSVSFAAAAELAAGEESGHELDALVADRDLDGRAGAGAARRFLAERRRIEGLRFQPASGYWQNTYVPGDPVLRLLESRLARQGGEVLQGFVAEPPELHDAVAQPSQPFDAPTDAAIAVYLDADRRRIEGPSRLLVQVGLQATQRQGGRRGAMNTALVLDLRQEPDLETATAMRSLVSALGAARDVGDRFQLVVAGRPGGRIVGPEEFRHGPLQVAMDRLLEDREPGPGLDLLAALQLAMEQTAAADDPQSTLGSSVVLLATAQPLGELGPAIEELAHLSAVAGIPVSAIGLGDGFVRDELDRVALAGQGNRRLLVRAAEAESLVDRELTSAGRAVARALRLRIRLAPGVELVDVLDSRRLDEVSAQRVRVAEQSIDRRLARNLGIAADRGEDEEGIQIVIPSFYAGTSHVVLLDVVAKGPGPIADVTVRYKDLVHLRNGVARANLTVRRGEAAPGPLELNVLENLLARELRSALEAAGNLLARGNVAQARAGLEQHRLLLAGLRREVRGLERDPQLDQDLALLHDYVALLDAGAASDPAGRTYLTDSLYLAGRLKVLPRPPSLGGSS